MKIIIIILTLITFATQTQAQAKITAIQAKLFYNEKKSDNEKDVSGSFSPNILNGDFALWNVIIGAGDAEGYTNQTSL